MIRQPEKGSRNVYDIFYAAVSFHVECKVGQPRPLIDP